MATIKAGTYRFNDVLTVPSELLAQAVDFEFELDVTSVGGGVYQCISDAIAAATSGAVLFRIASYSPFDDTMEVGQEMPFYSDGVWLVDSVQTITIPNDTEVSAEFAEWFTANTVQQKQISGKWKFNNVLTYAGYNEVAVNFTAAVPVGDMVIIGQCDFLTYGYNLNVRVVSSDPDLSAMGFPLPLLLSVYDPEVDIPWEYDLNYIDFGTEPQTISAEFYNWLTANATQPTASVSHNGEEIASLFPGQTATLKCAGMKMAGDVVVAVAENVGGGVCDKTHIIEVDELPETGEDGTIYSVPSFSAVALCVDGNIVEDFAKENGTDAKHYTAVTLPETGEQNDVCYVESENEVYIYMDDWYAASVLLPILGFSVEMKGVINRISEITEDGYYVVMGGKALSVFKEGRPRTLLIKGELGYSSNNPGVCYVDGVEPYYDSKIIIPSISPDGLTVNAIGADAFNGCAALTAIVIPDSVETIGRAAFENCYALNSLTMGSGVKTIADNAFARCYALETVTIPDSVQTIGDNAFNSCYLLYEVTIGSGVKTIGVNAFRYCSDLYTIVFNGTMAQWETINKDIAWHEGTAAVEVTCTDGKVAL